jgi:hypothetical protein
MVRVDGLAKGGKPFSAEHQGEIVFGRQELKMI